MANVLTLRNLRKITGAFEINDDAQCVVVNTVQGEVQVIDFASILAICNNTVFYYTSSALSAINSIEVENGMRKYTLVDGTTVIPFDATAVGTTFIKDACQTAEEPATAEEEPESGTEAEEEEIDDTPVAKAVSGRRGRKPKAEHVVEEPVSAEENEDDELELNDEDDEDDEDEIESNDEVESDDEVEADDELELDEDDEDEEEELPAKKQPARKTKSTPAEEEDDDELELDEDSDDGFEFEDDAADDDHENESSSDDDDDDEEEDELEFEDESDDSEDEEEEAVEEDDDDDFDI